MENESHVVASHPPRVPLFYFFFGLVFTALGLYAWRAGSTSSAPNVELPILALFLLVFVLLGPVPLIAGAQRLFVFLRWGRPSLTFTQTADRNLTGKFDAAGLPAETNNLAVTLSCRRVRKTPVPLNIRAGAFTSIYGDTILWSQGSSVDPNYSFRFQLPKELPASESLDNNPTFGTFWFLELRIKGLPFGRIYFTLPVT